jgi:hypothetical protein
MHPRRDWRAVCLQGMKTFELDFCFNHCFSRSL